MVSFTNYFIELIFTINRMGIIVINNLVLVIYLFNLNKNGCTIINWIIKIIALKTIKTANFYIS